jgi:hypothetical protein
MGVHADVVERKSGVSGDDRHRRFQVATSLGPVA